jgi:hypothetical protein
MVLAFPAPRSVQLLKKAENRFTISIYGPVVPSWNHHWPIISNFDGWQQKVANVGCHGLACGWKFVRSSKYWRSYWTKYFTWLMREKITTDKNLICPSNSIFGALFFDAAK